MIVHRHGLEEPLVALTFDDGPSQWTDQILDALGEHDATATFFALGCFARDRPDTLRRIVASGSEVGNHAWSHRKLITLTDAEIVDELRRTTAVLEEVTETELRYWRPPHFLVDERVRAAVAPLGLEEVGASILTEDYLWPAEQTVESVVGRVRPGDVVDLHDGRSPLDTDDLSAPTRGETVEAVRRILEWLVQANLRCVTISELTGAQ